jgi:hypothetical protein
MKSANMESYYEKNTVKNMEMDTEIEKPKMIMFKQLQIIPEVF